MKRVLVNLNDADLRLADGLAGRLGVSRSEAFRRGLAKLAEAADQPGISEAELARRREAGQAIRRLAERISQCSKGPTTDSTVLIRRERDRRTRHLASL